MPDLNGFLIQPLRPLASTDAHSLFQHGSEYEPWSGTTASSGFLIYQYRPYLAFPSSKSEYPTLEPLFPPHHFLIDSTSLEPRNESGERLTEPDPMPLVLRDGRVPTSDIASTDVKALFSSSSSARVDMASSSRDPGAETPWDDKTSKQFESKRPGEFFDPCQEAANRSVKCLHRNGGDRQMCTDYFQAYRDCKKQWLADRKDAKAKSGHGWFS